MPWNAAHDPNVSMPLGDNGAGDVFFNLSTVVHNELETAQLYTLFMRMAKDGHDPELHEFFEELLKSKIDYAERAEELLQARLKEGGYKVVR